MWVTGLRTEAAGTWVSCMASIASLALAIAIGLDFFGGWPAVFGLAFLAVFPPDLLVANCCWTDSLVGLVGTATAYLTFKILAGGYCQTDLFRSPGSNRDFEPSG
jgi:hypothetical protein